MAMDVENQQPVAAPPSSPPPLPLPQAYKHHCKVCKKGFVCGRGLGGPMRAHGVADDDGIGSADEDVTFDEDETGPCVGSGTGDDSTEEEASNNKRMYALRANPGRLKSCRVCENCGKEFTSWKSLLDHGRCNYDEEENGSIDDGVRRCPPLRDTDDDAGEEVETDLALAAAGWSKGKRTRRGKVVMGGVGNRSVSSEEEDLANCLVMLSSSSRSVQQPPPAVVVEADQDSCVLPNKDDAQTMNKVLVPQQISMLAPNPMVPPELNLLAPPQVVVSVSQPTVPRGLFECKACKKVFTSHQALGGHRASHKKVKGCYAAKLDSSNQTEPATPAARSEIIKTNPDEHPMTSASSAIFSANAPPEIAFMHVDETPAPPAAVPPVNNKRKGKMHECTICHRVFTSGQALGGHKRCHWLTAGSGDPTAAGVAAAAAAAKLHHPTIVAQDNDIHAICHQLTLGRPMFDGAVAAHPTILDLNLKTNTAAAEATATQSKQATELNGSVQCLNAPASLYMQSWTATSSRNDAAGVAAATEDEADSRNAKRAKISDLKNMNVAAETSPWLQVGIGHPSQTEKTIQE